MNALARYCRLYAAFGRYALVNELIFRGNFLVKIFVEILWLFILLIFTRTLFGGNTQRIAGWTESQYFFFVGCYFALEGLIETLFLENCNEFSDLIRSGDLDFFLLKPIDEQFLISCRSIDWSCAPNALMGIGVMSYALAGLGWPGFDKAALFVVLMFCGLGMAYGFLLTLTAASVTWRLG